MGYNVAIDGPAGAGKSTIAKLVKFFRQFLHKCNIPDITGKHKNIRLRLVDSL